MKAILAVLAALMLSGGIAHADFEDDKFLAAVHKQGITAKGGDPTLIDLAHMMCKLLSEGYSTNALIQMGQLNGNNMSADDTKVMVMSAEAAYCPEYIQ